MRASQQDCEIGGAGAQIQDQLIAPGLLPHGSNRSPAPVAVYREREKVIEEIVARRNRAEHVANLARLLDQSALRRPQSEILAQISARVT